jgi:hypothetical protein
LLTAGFADDGAAALAVAEVDGASKFFGYCHAQKEKNMQYGLGLHALALARLGACIQTYTLVHTSNAVDIHTHWHVHAPPVRHVRHVYHTHVHTDIPTKHT